MEHHEEEEEQGGAREQERREEQYNNNRNNDDDVSVELEQQGLEKSSRLLEGSSALEGRRHGGGSSLSSSSSSRVFVFAVGLAVVGLVIIMMSLVPRWRANEQARSRAATEAVRSAFGSIMADDASLKALFDRLDHNRDGVVDANEFIAGVKAAPPPLAPPLAPEADAQTPNKERPIKRTTVTEARPPTHVFDPQVVRMVDSFGHNVLLRGSIPVGKDGAFVYDELRAEIEVLLPELKGQKFHLIDVSLLGTMEGEMPDVDTEAKFFDGHPELGSFVWWPLWGTNTSAVWKACQSKEIPLRDCENPTMQPAVYRDRRQGHVVEILANEFLVDKMSDRLVERTSQLRAWLTDTTTRSIPTLIYFHCECGCDRTGELAAAYNMRYHNMSFTDAIDADVALIQRTIGYCNQVAVQYLCLSMVASHQYPHPNDCDTCSRWACNDVFHDCDGRE